MQRNVYHYEDKRGTVSEGPLCGPWHITASCSTLDGLIHPARSNMVTWNLPGGDLCWASKHNGVHDFAGCELFLHHDDHLRMSVGIVYGASCAPGTTPTDRSDRLCQTLALIREDSRGPWPSQYWSASREACAIEHKDVQQFFESRGVFPEMAGSGHAIFAGLSRFTIENVTVSQTRWGKIGPEDVILICSDRSVAIAAPKTYSGAVTCTAAWWPTKEVMYIIEIEWDEHGSLRSLRRANFPLLQDRSSTI